MKNINIELPEPLHIKLKIAVATNKTTIREYIIKALEKQLKR